MLKAIHISILSLTAALLLGAGGCASMTPGEMSWVQTTSNQPRAGNVYMLRGFIGIWSFGINHIGEVLNKNGIRTSVYQDDQWDNLADAIEAKYTGAKDYEPLVLIGHSYGADDIVRIARQLEAKHITVDLLVTLDPVTPPRVPSNVKRCYNLYQSNGVFDALPFFRGVPLKTDKPETGVDLVNADVKSNRKDLLEPNTNHFNIEKKEKIHAEILKQVLATCPPREQWAATHRPDNHGPTATAKTASGTIPLSASSHGGSNSAKPRTMTNAKSKPTARTTDSTESVDTTD